MTLRASRSVFSFPSPSLLTVILDTLLLFHSIVESIITTTGEIQTELGTETQKRSMNVMIPEQQDHSTYRQDTEAGYEPNHRTEHGQYYINRRQKTNAVMSNLISLPSTDYTTECDIRRPIEPLIADDTSLFRGVVRKKTRRIVLYNVRADRPYELVSGAVKLYAENKVVTITFLKLLKIISK